MIDDVTNNLIKVGQSIGLCDSAELRKLKNENEQHKLEIEKQTRTDEFVKNHSKTIKELDEMRPSYESVVLYEAYSTGNLSALKEMLKPKDTKNPKVNESKFENVRVSKKPDAPDAEGLAS
jgi:tRNA U34 5-carboxymethylaminomethyl modifying enzyme MnmG/GidA